MSLISAPEGQLGRFDHGLHPDHSKNCNRCHRLAAKNTWRQSVRVAKAGGLHAACTDCHRKRWTRFNPAKDLAFCKTCHLGLSRRRPRFNRIVYPPYRTGPGSPFFMPSFNHGDHAGPDAKAAAGACTTCHAVSGREKRGGHETCGTAACHGEKAKPSMERCTECHRLGQAPTRDTDPVFAVDRVFSHQSHDRSAPNTLCTDCHNNVSTPAGQPVPLPAMITCERCHDGQAAFSALGNCLQCHDGRRTIVRPVERPAAPRRYGHTLHFKEGVTQACDACHESTPSGQLRFPVSNAEHRPCIDCHAEQFRQKGSPVCFTCHEHNQPWRPNPRHAAFSSETEFTVGLSHAAHRKSSCQACHAMGGAKKQAPSSPPSGLAPSHGQCSACHTQKYAPKMTACADCHTAAGDNRTAQTSPDADDWRVSATFSHDAHRLDARTQKPLACETCHAEVSTSDVEPPPRPQKKSCEICHEGNTAFHVTGFECYRCHTQPS